MSLLVLDRVTKHFGERTALAGVSLVVEAGELVGVWGRRRSGRTTLLAVAAGIEPVTEGVVRFDDIPISQRSQLGVRGGISYCTRDLPPAGGATVTDQIAMPLLGERSTVRAARHEAERALRRLGIDSIASELVADLSHADVTRAVLARALVSEPRLLVIDQPTAGVSIATERDAMLGLLRGLADDGIAILMAVDEGAELAGADRALTIDAGELHGETEGRQAADVIPLRRAGGA